MELADDRYVVAVVTYANEESDMRQLVEALEDISRKMTGKNNVDVVNAETRLIPPIPPMIDTPRQAFFKEKKRIPWREAKGKIAAEALIPYPPGIPLVNPGELVTEEIWEYMEEYRKKGLHFTDHRMLHWTAFVCYNKTRLDKTGGQMFETDIMECKWAAGLCDERIQGTLSGIGCRHFLYSGE